MGYTAMEKQVRTNMEAKCSFVGVGAKRVARIANMTLVVAGGTQQFFEEVQARGQGERVRIFEYFREGWTFHGKGLWYTPAGQSRPILTMIGSPNFGTRPPNRLPLEPAHRRCAVAAGRRSTDRDLEAQVVVLTEDPELRGKLAEVIVTPSLC
jgi:hypothetical protein